MTRVRHAGSLIKTEDNIHQKYWCVIREKSFLVYPNYDGIQNDPINNVPVYILPISHLSATAFVLPISIKRTPTPYALELHCAQSDRTFIFYVKDAEALETWVDAIKAESSADEVTMFDSPQGALLPPELGVRSSPKMSPALRVKSQSSGDQITTTMKYLQGLENTKLQLEADAVVKPYRSPHVERKTHLNEKMELSGASKRWLTDTPRCDDYRRDEMDSLTPLSSPALSSLSSSSRHHRYQDSADESSQPSSNASSPKISKFVKTSVNRKQKTTLQPAKVMNKPKKSHIQNKMEKLVTREDELHTDSITHTSGHENSEINYANPYFYTGEKMKKIKSTPGMRHVGNKTSTKRHTISSLPHYTQPEKQFQEERKNTTENATKINQQPTSRQGRHSIAPLSSLDLQLNQRRRSNKPFAQLAEPPHQEKEHFSDVSDDDSDLDDTTGNANSRLRSETYSALYEGQEFDETFEKEVANNISIPQETQVAKLNIQKSSPPAGVNTPVLRLKRKLKANNTSTPNQISPRSALDATNTGESSRRSGIFSSKILNRVSSMVGKRSNKSADEPQITACNITPENMSLPQESFTRVTTLHSETEVAEPARNVLMLSSLDQKKGDHQISMEGFLYRRKKMKWNRKWAVLKSDKLLRFYKNDHNTEASEPVATIDLKNGCEVESVIQDKNNSTFTLVPKTSSHKVVHSNSVEDFFSKSKHDSSSKSIDLLCKSTKEFMHWMKAIVLLNSSPNTVFTTPLQHEIRNVQPLKQSPTDPVYNRKGFYRSFNDSDMELSQISSDFHTESDIPSHTADTNNRSLEMETGHHHSREDSNEKETRAVGSRVTNYSPVGMHSFHASTQPSPGQSKNHTEETGSNIDLSKDEEKITIFADFSSYIDDTFTSEKRISVELSPSSSLQATSEFFTTTDTYEDEINNNKERLLKEDNHSNIPSVVLTDSTNRTNEDQSTDVKADNQGATLHGKYLPTISTYSSANNDNLKTSFLQASDSNQDRSEQQIVNYALKRDQIATDNTEESNDTINERCNCGSPGCTCTSNGVADNKEYLLKFNYSERSTATEANSLLNIPTPSQQENGRSGEVSPPFLRQLSTETVLKPTFTASRTIQAGKQSCGGSEQSPESSETRKQLPSSRSDPVNLFESAAISQDEAGESDSDDVDTSVTSQIYKEENFSISSLRASINNKKADDKSKPVEGQKITNKHSAPYSDTATQRINLPIFVDQLAPVCNITLTTEISESERNNLPLPSKFQTLRRSTSDSNILDPIGEEGYKMRIIKRSVPEMTKIDFIEIYASRSCSSIDKLKTMRGMKDMKAMFGKENFNIDSDSSSTPNKDSHDDSSRSSSSSKLGEIFSKNKIRRTFSRKSTGSDESELTRRQEKRNNWLLGIKFRRSIKDSDDVSNKSKVSKPQVLSLPATQLSAASHRGYLDRKNKKKQWERFWCVFQDTCLYCYNSPYSNTTRDVVMLRGYEIIADVTNMKRTKFVFRLEQQDAPTLYFSTDNHQDYLLWVGTLERETRSVTSNTSEDTPEPKVTKRLFSTQKQSIEAVEHKLGWMQNASQENLEKEIVELQRQKLLKEIAAQQQQILEEQRMLDGQISSESVIPVSEVSQSRRVSRRDNVIEKYEKARDEEEMRMTKYMALLNRRRNSAQLKVDQLAKEIAPKSGKKRRQNHQNFAALEAKLKEMKDKLDAVDSEIQTLEFNKQNTLDKIRERQGLELLVAEQQENLKIMCRHDNDILSTTQVRRRHVAGSRDTLESIDEISGGLRHCSSESSGSVDGGLHGNHALIPLRYKDLSPPVVFEETSSESILSDEFIYMKSLSHSTCSLDDVVAQSSLASSLSSLNMSKDSLASTSAKAIEKKNNKDEIDPAVLASIEMFEEFSKMKLDSLQRGK